MDAGEEYHPSAKTVEMEILYWVREAADLPRDPTQEPPPPVAAPEASDEDSEVDLSDLGDDGLE